MHSVEHLVVLRKVNPGHDLALFRCLTYDSFAARLPQSAGPPLLFVVGAVDWYRTHLDLRWLILWRS